MSRRNRKYGICMIVLVLNGLVLALSSCDLFKPPSNAVADIQINTDPQDPMLGRVIGATNGEILEFYGQKDENGLVTRVEIMLFFPPGAAKPYTYQYDADMRPTMITGPDGEIATLTYVGDNVSVTLKDNSGNISIETFPLSASAKARLHDRVAAAQRGLAESASRLAAAKAKSTVIPIQGRVIVQMQTKWEAMDPKIRDACVVVSATGTEGVIPVAFDGTGYRFTLAHRVQDLNVPISECEQVYGYTSLAFSAAGVVLSALALACIGVTGGFCGFLLGPGGALMGVVLGDASIMAGYDSFQCRDLIMASAVKSGLGRQTVNISAAHPTMSFFAATTVQYDLFNVSDPITQSGSFERTFDVDVEAAIAGIRTIPTAPAAHQSYRVEFMFYPPSASIRYTITGTDGFSFGETLTGDGKSGVVTGDSIPGGADTVRDTIVADILLDGIKVGSSTPITIAFH